MTTPNQPTGETLEQFIERVIFEHPATHALREQWETTKQTERDLFERVCREEYEYRLNYHQICQTPNLEETTRRETALCTLLFQEELEQRLFVRWNDILRRVRAVLADVNAADETPDPGDQDSSGV
ncbi:MAG: hypothetical protein U0792_17910 [Gemmataceae bacterium]